MTGRSRSSISINNVGWACARSEGFRGAKSFTVSSGKWSTGSDPNSVLDMENFVLVARRDIASREIVTLRNLGPAASLCLRGGPLPGLDHRSY